MKNNIVFYAFLAVLMHAVGLFFIFNVFEFDSEKKEPPKKIMHAKVLDVTKVPGTKAYKEIEQRKQQKIKAEKERQRKIAEEKKRQAEIKKQKELAEKKRLLEEAKKRDAELALKRKQEEEEKKRLEEEKRKAEAEKKRLEEEKRKVEAEKKRIEEEKKRKAEQEKKRIEEENKLWHLYLKKIRPRFTRQKIIGSYIVDFYCPKLKIVIEIDGVQHYLEENTDYEKRRETYLQNEGYKLLRFYNSDINKELKNTKTTI